MEEVLKDVNPELKAKTLKDFGRMSFENDDSFEEYLTETTTDIQTINQTIVNQGLAGHQPGNGGAGKGGKLSDAEYDDMV